MILDPRIDVAAIAAFVRQLERDALALVAIDAPGAVRLAMLASEIRINPALIAVLTEGAP